MVENTIEMIYKDEKILKILEDYLEGDTQEKATYRKQLYDMLEDHYARIQKYGILQFHFVDQDGRTVLRMHKPQKFGDNLTEMRYSFRYVNEFQKPVRGFEAGKTSVGFRDVHPLFSQDNRYLGCVDIAFAPEKVQESLMVSSEIYSNLIFHKSVIDIAEWKRNKSQVYYRKSPEHEDYYEYTSDEHDESFQQKLIEQNKGLISSQIENGEKFAVYSGLDKEYYIIAFLPLHDIENKLIGYLISYTHSANINMLYKDFYFLNIVIIILMLLISVFAYGNLISYQALQDEKNRFHTLSLYDNLTGLPNRHLLQEKLSQFIVHAKRYGDKFAVLFIDLDNFKNINDSHGHDMGDEALQIASERMQEVLRESDVLARIGGDEFIIVAEEIHELQNSVVIGNKIIEKLQKPLDIRGVKYYIGASIGISIYPDDGIKSADLLKFADVAMYRAKESGKNNIQFYSPEMMQEVLGLVSMENELRAAIKNEEFVVHYQPQMDIKDNKLLGMEALVRWKHPSRGIVSPIEFIPYAEKYGLIIDIDRMVLKTAIKDFAMWYAEGLNPGKISLNLSVQQLRKEDFLDYLVEVLKENDFQYEWLGFEVTESEIMKDPQKAISVLEKISALGIRLSVDDFGTGYSSLEYLKRLPVSQLKIDRSFIISLPDDEEDVAISKAIIALSKSLNFDVVAEGVETEEQKQFLFENGCYYIQGYLYSKPLPADEVYERFLKNKYDKM